MSANQQSHDGVPSAVATKDPVCGMDVVPGQAPGGSAEHDRTTYWFCSPGCRAKFVADPGRYVAAGPASLPPGGAGIHTCIGLHVAQMEARVCLEEALRRMPDWEVDWSDSERLRTEFVQGFARLAVTFAPR